MVAVSNTTSLSLVKDELDATLGQVEVYIQTYIEDRDNPQHVEKSIELLDQLRGVFKLIEMPAPQLLCEEMLAAGKVLVEVSDAADEKAARRRDACLGAVSSALFVLARYLEYVLKHRSLAPVLLVPAINELRIARGEPAFPESHFTDLPDVLEAPAPEGGAHSAAQIGPACRRLRQMYQVGLLGILRGQDAGMSLHMMSRALERVDKACRGHPIAPLWWAAVAALESMHGSGMEITGTRKALLTRVDKYFKQLVYSAENTLKAAPPKSDLREMIYLCALADEPGAKAKAVLEAAGNPQLELREKALAAERQRLSGPGGAVLRSVSAGLREELNRAKDIVDMSTRVEDDTDFAKLIENLNRIAETLAMLQLEKGRQRLLEQVANLQRWQDEKTPPSEEEMARVADMLLYLDSAVNALESEDGGLSAELLGETDDAIAPSELDDATAAVIKEIQSGLGLAKHAIMDCAESDWDTAHLGGVPAALDGVQGGLIVMGQERSAKSVIACRKYIREQLIEQHVHPDSAQLETLADALTSLEYYVEGLASRKHIGESILDVAEESLKELGYPVS